jgi:hypothetical protein
VLDFGCQVARLRGRAAHLPAHGPAVHQHRLLGWVCWLPCGATMGATPGHDSSMRAMYLPAYTMPRALYHHAMCVSIVPYVIINMGLAELMKRCPLSARPLPAAR